MIVSEISRRWYASSFARFNNGAAFGQPATYCTSTRTDQAYDGQAPTVAAMAITIYGVCALTFMMSMYALEARGQLFVLGFATGCLLSSLYGFLSGAWPFGVIELIWSAIAVRKYQTRARSSDAAGSGAPNRAAT